MLLRRWDYTRVHVVGGIFLYAGRCCLVLAGAGRYAPELTPETHDVILKKTRTTPGDHEPADAVDMNQVVSYNFARARALRGWTQEETARVLERFTGQRLPQASISAIERTYDGGDKRREFDAQEIFVFSRAFELPLIWFFLPPDDDRRPIRQAGENLDQLFEVILGRPDQVEALVARFRELGFKEPDADDVGWERLTGQKTARQLYDYRTRRKELLLALLDEWSDDLDRAVEDLARVFDHLRLVGIRGLVTEKLRDREFLYDAAQRKTLRKELDAIAKAEAEVAEFQEKRRPDPATKRSR